MDALNQISKNSKDDDINIIVEDDVMFDNSMETKMMDFINNKKFLDDTCTPYDIIFFGLPGQPDEVKKSSELQIINIPDIKVLPCCDSYYISKSCAKALAKSYIPLKFPNNIQLSYLITKNSFKVGKVFPNLMADGSKLGITPSSISPNNILIFNSAYKEIYKLLEKETPTYEDIKNIENILKNNEMKNSPDFVFIEGLFYLRTKRYKEAKEYFDRAIIMYEENSSPLSNQSAIIQNYIDLCKYIQ
jgi:tetratricopeptide (TPR) repeat protein